MKNKYFPNEDITENDLYFVCSMIERTARKIRQPNKYVVNAMGCNGLVDKLSVANVLHSANLDAVASDWVEEYNLQDGETDITAVNPELVTTIPTELQMGKVYTRLILSTLQNNEDYADGIIRVYNNPICEVIDDYNSSAYYEPSYYITEAYKRGGF